MKRSAIFSYFSVFIFILLISACAQDKESPYYQGLNQKEQAMNPGNNTAAIQVEVPPIDVAAATVFETASFGLG